VLHTVLFEKLYVPKLRENKAVTAFCILLPANTQHRFKHTSSAASLTRKTRSLLRGLMTAVTTSGSFTVSLLWTC